MKTEPMLHQIEGERRMAGREFFGLAAEQGTGKTRMALGDAEANFVNRNISALLVFAPNGVHSNWIRREIPTHMDCALKADYWISGAGKRRSADYANFLKKPDPGVLRIFAMNIDAVNTKKGRDFALRFLEANGDVEVIVDESSRIKNLTSQRTKALIDLAPHAAIRRILSGTMITNGPLDMFAQFEFLGPRRGLLGTTSYRAFAAEHAEMLRKDHPLIKSMIQKTILGAVPRTVTHAPDGTPRWRTVDELLELVRATHPGVHRMALARVPQIIARNPDGTPRWRNLDKLREVIAPHIFRVLKKDCLDLPDKIYQTVLYELLPKQRKDYELVANKLRWERDNGIIDRFTGLTAVTKLRQIVSGFMTLDGEPTQLMPRSENPKFTALREAIEDIDGQFIVWCSFKQEIYQIRELLRELEIETVEYHGETPKDERELAVDSFQAGRARCFLATADAAGIGLTLTAANVAIYFSRDYSLEKRLQSEDRNHRIGTQGEHVLYIDLVATDTIDEKIITRLVNKQEVADAVLNFL